MRTIGALLLISLATACIAGDETETDSDETAVDGKADSWGGAAAYVYYQCETATNRNGYTWRYKTSFFNNTSPSAVVWVSRESASSIDEFPPLTVGKIGTDTFSDGKVTVKLVQKGAGKSIDVTHHTMNWVASAANGWCSRVAVPPPTGHVAHDFFYGTLSWASRTWTFTNAGSSLVSLPVSPKMVMSIPFNSNPNQPVSGTVQMSAPCSPIINLYGPDGSIAGGTSPGAERVKGFFVALDFVLQSWRAVDCVRNGGYQWSTLPVRAQIGTSGLPAVPTAFLNSCGTGPQTMFLTYSGPSSTSVMCVRGYEAQSSANRDYLRVRAINATTLETSDWMSVVDEN